MDFIVQSGRILPTEFQIRGRTKNCQCDLEWEGIRKKEWTQEREENLERERERRGRGRREEREKEERGEERRDSVA